MVSVNSRPLQEDLPFGARIAGLTPEALGNEHVRRQIYDIFEDRGMIVFEDVEPTSDMQVLLSEAIGPLKDHPIKAVPRLDQKKLPGVITISAHPDINIVEIDGKRLTSWQPWHFDHSYNNELNRAGVLRSEKIAPEGGLTGFADGIQIYRDLSPALREKIEHLTIIYTLDLHYSRQRFGLPKNFREIIAKGTDILEIAKTLPRALHPAVWTRNTGEKVLHMSPYGAVGILDMETPEGDALFQEVWEEIDRTIKPYYHQWKITDMVLWDNWRILHTACGCDPKYERIVHRTTIKGDYGFGRWETEPKVPEPAAAEMM